MPPNRKPGCAGRRTPGLSKTCKHNATDTTSAAQRGRLLAALKTRPLSTLEARRELDVLHPAARVMELRRDGYPIERAWTHDVTSEGYLHRVARYHLTGERAQRELF
ncbi:MAG: helix-turn-helix domain-containing protein [Burkholderiales bacterium]|nr:helix-turn-helix domain-containing protein [Burkholderiales bacterium]MDP2398967.1 helix-turn-helix domain-containing protein [Burkholderiales bacterium]